MTAQLADPANATLSSSLLRSPESGRKYRSMTKPKFALITGVTGQRWAGIASCEGGWLRVVFIADGENRP